MRAREIDGDLFCFEAAHALGIFDCLLNGIDGGVGINDYALAQTTCFCFADPHNVQQPRLAYFANDTRHPTGPNIEADCVW